MKVNSSRDNVGREILLSMNFKPQSLT